MLRSQSFVVNILVGVSDCLALYEWGICPIILALHLFRMSGVAFYYVSSRFFVVVLLENFLEYQNPFTLKSLLVFVDKTNLF